MAKRFKVYANKSSDNSKVTTASDLRNKLNAIASALGTLSGVTFVVSAIHLLSQDDDETDFQFRAICYVHKQNRKIKWDEVYTAINAVQAPYYESVPIKEAQGLIDWENERLADIRNRLGDHFKHLVKKPIDDVDKRINSRLSELATDRTLCGWSGILAAARLKTLTGMSREAIRESALEEINKELAA